jgi:hypothetical protein
MSTASAPVVPLRAERLSLPAQLHARPLLQLLPPAIAARYSHERAAALLRPGHEVTVLDHLSPLPRPRVHGRRSEYLATLRRLHGLGMLAWTTQPAAVNGVFAIEKDRDSDRLILDARWANRLFIDPPHVVLPTAAHLAAVRVPPRAAFYAAKSDISDYYHHQRVPHWLTRYFAMPPLSAAECVALGVEPSAGLYPCLATMPMGWSHAVYLGQCVHEHLLYHDAGLARADSVLDMASPALSGGRVVHGAYIDDFFCLSLSRCEAHRQLQRVLDAYRRAGFVVKDSKVVLPTTAAVPVLGFELCGEAVCLQPGPQLLHRMVAATRAVLQAVTVTGHQLSVLLGHWAWLLLLRRPAFAALQHAYRYARLAGWRPFTLWRSVRRELASLLALLPLLRMQLSAGVFHRVMASDASEQAGGVVSLACSPAMDEALTPLASSRRQTLLQTTLAAAAFEDATEDQRQRAAAAVAECPAAALAVERAYDAVAHGQWRADVTLPWRMPSHINALEMHAVSLAVHRVATYRAPLDSRVYLLLDNTVCLFALLKGRTSSVELLLPLRKVAAVALAAGLVLMPAWLPSELNPADAPSRLRAVPPP